MKGQKPKALEAKITRLEREIAEIDRYFYGQSREEDRTLYADMLERKRDDHVQLQLQLLLEAFVATRVDKIDDRRSFRPHPLSWETTVPRALLQPKDFDHWLAGTSGTELLRPASNDYLQVWPVSRRVNGSRAPNDDPTLSSASLSRIAGSSSLSAST